MVFALSKVCIDDIAPRGFASTNLELAISAFMDLDLPVCASII